MARGFLRSACSTLIGWRSEDSHDSYAGAPSQHFGIVRISAVQTRRRAGRRQAHASDHKEAGGKAFPTRSGQSPHPRRNAALAAYLGAVHHSLMTIPTGVSVSAFRKRSDCRREWFVRLGGWFVTVKRTDDWMRKLR